NEPLPFALTAVTTQNQEAHLTFQLPSEQKLQVSEAQNPPRLIVQASDTPASTFVERNIQWTPGVLWRQQWVNLGGDRFPVFALELNPRQANLALRPIWTNPNAMMGIERLDSMANRWQAAAAINGGFFNRNTQLPLGAVRRDNQWYSGPILNRGAIAWDDQGNYDFARLYLQETLTTNTQQRIPVLYLNSGYVQAGVSRYTSAWGTTYTPLTDNEIIIMVRGNQVIEQYPGGAANSTRFPIPPDGQLLTIRANSTPANWLAVGTQIQIESRTLPENFANYPHIMGAGPMLLQNRQIVLDAESEKFSAAFVNQAAPRSVIARSDRGTILILAIHNREGGRGPTLAETAQIVRSLGMVDALNLDGGSSTSLYLGGQLINRPPNTAARVHNGIGLYLLRR
ncbi:MAG: phosphodiester glycosidase family protein, partial [Jaaginema sp. PMC 1078.18]|nr:phosphodiester glycosidase family protein [Jaaginema sp. PMC 1078.18]